MTVVKYLLLIHFSKMNKSYSALKFQCCLSSYFQYLYAASHYYKAQIQAIRKMVLILHKHPYRWLEYYGKVKHHHHPFVSFFNSVLCHKSSIKVQDKVPDTISLICNARHYPFGNNLYAIFDVFLLSLSLSRKGGKESVA